MRLFLCKPNTLHILIETLQIMRFSLILLLGAVVLALKDKGKPKPPTRTEDIIASLPFTSVPQDLKNPVYDKKCVKSKCSKLSNLNKRSMIHNSQSARLQFLCDQQENFLQVTDE